MRQLLIRFFFLLRIRHWCPCLSRFNYSWIDFLNIQLWFHLKSSTPSWLRKFFSSFVDRNFAKKKKTGKTNMGSVLGGAMKETMDDNMKKNQEFMLETQKIQVRQCQMSLGNCLVLLVCQSNIDKAHYLQHLNKDTDQVELFILCSE